jgi:glycosyltransferase involved in cell wall biosynthesis
VDESGRERIVPSLLWQLERLTSRHELFVYVLRYHETPRSYQLRGATVRDLGRPTGLFRQYRAALRAVREDGPLDLLHGFWALPSGLVAALAARRLGIGSVVTCDSGEFVALPEIGYGSQLRWRQRTAVRWAARLATRTLVCSDYQRALARAHGVEAGVVPMGVDTGLFRPSADVDGPPWRLLHVASLSPVKDQRTLFSAFRHVVDAGLDAELHVAGEDTMAGAGAACARECGIERRVVFHGLLTSEDLVPLYQRSHLFVLSSRHEAAGVVALEAAACGVPVVGTAVGYLADWAPERAVAVPAGDAVALGRAIVDLLRDRDRRRQIASAARQWVTAHDADWTAHQLDAVYRAVSSTKRPPHGGLADGNGGRGA